MICGRVEFIGYTSEVLQDASYFAEHANRQDIALEDVRLAIQAKVNFSFTQPPAREVCAILSLCVKLSRLLFL